MLPEIFLNRMEELLKEEYQLFLNSYNDANVRSLRFNRTIMNKEEFKRIFQYPIVEIEYDNEGFYLKSDIKLGNSPFHHAGIIYFQEPAAMLPVNAIDIKENYKVLDLCAAPGGKTFQISSRLGEGGLLVSNEVNFKRSKILQSNIERLGLKNVLLMSMDADEIGRYYPNSFDLVVVDAPCSGEGMFRKDTDAIKEWSINEVLMCAKRQLMLLTSISDTVKENGYIVYSTCTYSLEENEMVVNEFLKNNDFKLIDVPPIIKKYTVDGYSVEDNEELKKCRRFYPHKAKGEGQFLAVFKRIALNDKNNDFKTVDLSLTNSEKILVDTFLDNIIDKPGIKVIKYNDNINAIELKDFKIVPKNILSLGVKIGEISNNHFIPHHHFFKAYGAHFKNKLDLKSGDIRLERYLAGEVIKEEGIKNGFGVITFNNYPIGGFKATDGVLKNHYPKGLRSK